MRRSISLLTGMILIAAMAMAQAPDLSKLDLVQRAVPDGPVLKVNGVNVGRQEFLSLYGAELGMLATHLQKTPDDAARLQTARHCLLLLAQREILRQEAVNRKLPVSDQEIHKQWQTQIEQMKKGISKGKPGDITEEQVLQIAGADKAAALDELRETLLIEKMREQLAKEGGVTVTDADVQTFYNQNKEKFQRPEAVHLLRIYVNTRGADEKKKAQGQQKIQQALSRIQAGESFETVAKAMSEAPDKERGGDAGIKSYSALPQSYVQKLTTMKAGDTSDVFEDELGFHIIRLLDASHGGEIALDTVKPLIKGQLMEAKMEPVIDKFCQPYFDRPGAVQMFLQLDRVLAAHPQADQLRKQVFGDAPKPDAAKPAKTKATTSKAPASKAKPVQK